MQLVPCTQGGSENSSAVLVPRGKPFLKFQKGVVSAICNRIYEPAVQWEEKSQIPLGIHKPLGASKVALWIPAIVLKYRTHMNEFRCSIFKYSCAVSCAQNLEARILNFQEQIPGFENITCFLSF